VTTFTPNKLRLPLTTVDVDEKFVQATGDARKSLSISKSGNAS